ncbi:MAG: DUF4886 domain-containing protein [Clostridia bacterium]|nr:DUF4886 domain-containing protein [Clostridia bacterium]
MRILAIGNSFSQDAARYLHATAVRSGLNIEIANLMIGGCPLEKHYRNMLSGEKAYSLEYNGSSTGFNVSLTEALLTAHWDVITVQQVSHDAPRYDTYTPYITELVAYIRKCAPKAKLIIHQTWGYEDGSARLTQELKYEKSADMLRDVVASYKKAAEEIKADGIIPSGEMMYKLHESGIEKVHRDTFHASFGVGRYALALLWIRMLSGISITGNSFSDFDVPVTEEEKRIAWTVVDSFEPIK